MRSRVWAADGKGTRLLTSAPTAGSLNNDEVGDEVTSPGVRTGKGTRLLMSTLRSTATEDGSAPTGEFTTIDAYIFERELEQLHPDNSDKFRTRHRDSSELPWGGWSPIRVDSFEKVAANRAEAKKSAPHENQIHQPGIMW